MMPATTDTHPVADHPDDRAWLAIARASALQALDQAAAAMILLDALVGTHQRGLGFLTYDGRLAQDAAVRAERRDRALSPDPGLNTGSIPAPANIPAIEADVVLWATLASRERKLRRVLVWYGIDPTSHLFAQLHQLNDRYWQAVTPLDDTDIASLIEHLRIQVDLVDDTDLLDELSSDLDEAVEHAGPVIDGHDRVLLDAVCPHCHHRTLVVDFNAGTIRCGRDPKTGRYTRCVCSDPLCACKVNPVSFRHTWHRSKGNAPDGWGDEKGRGGLAQRLNLQRITKKGTR